MMGRCGAYPANSVARHVRVNGLTVTFCDRVQETEFDLGLKDLDIQVDVIGDWSLLFYALLSTS